jgi:uncharacterized membrane-anchored protein YitT (DUF2179 family)
MQKIELTLKNEKEKSYRRIILLFVILHTLLFTYLLFDALLYKKGVAGLAYIILYTAYRLLVTNTTKQKFSYGSGFFFVFAVFFPIVWVMAADIVLFILSTVALQKTVFIFDKSEVQKLNFPSKKMEWQQFSNVILKDNILTLDFKNNRFLQAEIETENIHEDAFNTFAKEQLVNT